jgi:hypothetical protein
MRFFFSPQHLKRHGTCSHFSPMAYLTPFLRESRKGMKLITHLPLMLVRVDIYLQSSTHPHGTTFNNIIILSFSYPLQHKLSVISTMHCTTFWKYLSFFSKCFICKVTQKICIQVSLTYNN